MSNFFCIFRFLPPEIGDLIQLREFSVANNYIRTLPYELGRLFQLQNFGILGNPLPNDILSLYHEPNGLKKLLEFMLDHLNGKTVIILNILTGKKNNQKSPIFRKIFKNPKFMIFYGIFEN